MAYTQKTAAQVLAEVQTAFTNTFGDSTNLTPSSLNGVFIQELADIGVDVEATRALLYSGILNPNYASGSDLDAICALSQITRKAATSSFVTCTVTGLAGTVIPANSQIISTNNDIFINANSITIPSGGTIDAQFQSQSTGSIACDANTINRIVQTVAGWDTVNNSANGTLGTAIETDNALRLRRKKSLYINASSSLNSIISALENTAGVSDYNIFENYTSTSATVNGVTVDANSIYLVVNAAESVYTSIAAILYSKKSAGCGMAGSETVEYTDPDYDWITFTAKFDVATTVEIEINVTIIQNDSMTDTVVTDVKNALINNFTGADGSTPVYMGTTFYASRFYAPIVQLGIYDITTLTIGVVGGSPGTEVTLEFNEVGQLLATNINVTLA